MRGIDVFFARFSGCPRLFEAALERLRPKGAARVVLALAVLGASTSACDRAPSPEGLREWTPSDHERDDVPQGRQAAPPGKQAPQDKFAAVVEATWMNQCARCHGPEGRGDGPEGPMYRAADLTRADWQGAVSDEAIATTITTGRGRMPKFDLPADVTQGLVARIRALKDSTRERER